MKLLLVRHGQPDGHEALAPHDPSLSPAGLVQAHAVAELLRREPLSHIVSSPLARARQTAAPLAQALGLPVTLIDGWAEADRGATRYRSTETLRAQGGPEWAKFLQDPVTYLGSDPTQFRKDVLGALQATIALAPQGVVAVFSHGLPINTVLSHALGLQSIVHFLPAYGSISRLRARSGRDIGVISINESGHHRLIPS
jgi:broad specificity phosphatase PhoE